MTASVQLAKDEVKTLPELTVERTKTTEKYFQEYAKKKAQYDAKASSLDSYGPSDEFRAKIGKLKKANTVFAKFIDFLTEDLYQH